MKKGTLYIYGVRCSDNLGDNVICDTFLHIAKCSKTNYIIKSRDLYYLPIFAKILIRILSLIGIRTSRLLDIAMRKFSFPRHSQRDLICFAGGQMFYDYFIPQISTIVEVADSLNINVCFYGCGTGSVTQENRRKLIDMLSKSNVRYISLRDDSISLMNSIPQINKVPDIAIKSKEVYTVAAKQSNLIGIGIISLYNYNKQNKRKIDEADYIAYILNLISYYLQNNYDIQLFCNGNMADFITIEKIMKRVNNLHVTMANRPKNAGELVNLISRYSFVIASRLHAMIISYSLDTPYIALSWDPKIESFSRMINNTENNFNLYDAIYNNMILSLPSRHLYDKDTRIFLEETLSLSVDKILNIC